MSNRANTSGVRLNSEDAAVVKGMLGRGDRQHDIAAWFGVNGGRIAEIATGFKFGWVQANSKNLPPAGPYLSVREIVEAQAVLQATREALNEAELQLEKFRNQVA